jgi:hypothetical protein
LAVLGIKDLVRVQHVASRYTALARDASLWKEICYENSRAEKLRRQLQLLRDQDEELVRLRNAMTALPSQSLFQFQSGQISGHATTGTGSKKAWPADALRSRALASWEPGYPFEKIDYYEEYIHRYAPLTVGWLDLPRSSVESTVTEATGVGIMHDAAVNGSSHVISPLHDGSICIWDISARSTYMPVEKGRVLARTKPHLLSQHAPRNVDIMTETGAVECVTIDSRSCNGYFAVQNLLYEVDLRTLELRSTKTYPFPITALSEASLQGSIVVGTNMTVHTNDARDRAFSGSNAVEGIELIGGNARSFATLPQPGPLSILNHTGEAQDHSSIWVAGRFTSLLEYDRRFFPRLRSTIHSGARIASLAQIPYPFIGRELDLVRNPDAPAAMLQEARSRPGSTIFAAAEYKGKGSLELYGLPEARVYQNRQTASASKLLSVAPHGGRIVFSDGDGNVKWTERDGYSHVRTFNINTFDARAGTAESADVDSRSAGIWSGSGSEVPGQGDIVQKLVPVNVSATTSHNEKGRMDINSSDLLMWTGDGRLGLLGFSHEDPLGGRIWHDAVETQAQSVEEKAKEDAARQFRLAMRRALERNADEVRFVRGLGMM